MSRFIQTFPGGADINSGPDTLRINITAYKALKQSLQPKQADAVEVGGLQHYWSMIAPTDIQEQIQHTYEDYDSIQGRASQVITGVANSGQKALTLKDGISTTGGSFSSHISKVDSPLIYSGSERKQYTFTFLLMRHHSAAGDVTAPILAFKKYSCATMEGGDQIEFPSVFSVESAPYDFLNIPFAVLTDVQVTYNAPYINGDAQRAELTLTFKDLRPLYRSSFDHGGGAKITTGYVGI